MRLPIFLLILVFAESNRMPKILKTAVYFDREAVAFIRAAGHRDAAEYVLHQVQQANKLLNEAYLHIQLYVPVRIWPKNTTDIRCSSYVEQVKTKLKVPDPKFENLGMNHNVWFNLILSGRHCFGSESMTLMTVFPSDMENCGERLVAASAIPVMQKGVLAEDMIVSRIAGGLLNHIVGNIYGCFPKQPAIHLPRCVLDQVVKRNDTCLTQPPVPVTGDAVCSNSYRESGEECDCASYDHDCRQCCNMTTCAIIADCGRETTAKDPPNNANPPTTTGPPSTTGPPGGKSRKQDLVYVYVMIAVIVFVLVLVPVIYCILRHKLKARPDDSGNKAHSPYQSPLARYRSSMISGVGKSNFSSD